MGDTEDWDEENKTLRERACSWISDEDNLQPRIWFSASISVFLACIVLGLGWWWSKPDEFPEKNDFMERVGQAATIIAVIIGLQFTYHTVRASLKNTKLTQQTVQNATEQLQIDRDTKVAELFYKASEQLGIKDSAERRVAGLYSLERIADTHPEYYTQCFNVISTFLRSQSPVDLDVHGFPLGIIQHEVPPIDIAVAVQTLNERKHSYNDGEEKPLQFEGVSFQQMRFVNADLCGATFTRCDFTQAEFEDSRFSDCKFQYCQLENSRWRKTDLRGSVFIDVKANGMEFSYEGELPEFKTLATFHAKNPHNLPRAQVPYRIRDDWDNTTDPVELIDKLDSNTFIVLDLIKAVRKKGSGRIWNATVF